MLKTRNQKIEALFELLYNEIRTENNEMMKIEKTQKIEINKEKLIELIKDMEISLKISTECINKNEIIADTVSEGYFSNKKRDYKIKEKEKHIKKAKERKRKNEL